MNRPATEVVLQRCDGYDLPVVEAAVYSALAGLSHGNFHGKTVLLKPNLIAASGPALACTHPHCIAAVAAWFHGHGARVLVGDSPAFGSAAKVCDKHGITKALARLDVRLVEFTTPVRQRLSGGVTVTVAAEALECDLLVGLPKVKAHNQMYVTLAVKNLFGIVVGVGKAMMHMVHGRGHRHFAGILLDLLDLLPQQLHVADGICAMHVSGPLDGRPLPLYCIAAAQSPVAMDTALLSVLELDHECSPLWQEAEARKLLGSDGAMIGYPCLLPQDFKGAGFIAPMQLNPVRFNPCRFLRGMMRRVILRLRS
ncbi:MAG: hypothetical protein A2X81_03630 [Desulfobacterales bacterium GWB2_56_26]|nr:MAG: hypothetical protein A2X81_03630 [Desulfobacterales bacterium GWB2_56_26]